MSTATILRPQITVPLASGPVTVRDLPWLDAREFIRRLCAHAKDAMAAALPADGAPADAVRINVAALLPRLTEIITNVESLSAFLITKSTGKDEEWLNQLGTLEAMAVLDAALEVNLSDGLIELGKKVAGRLARVLPAERMTTSATPASATS